MKIDVKFEDHKDEIKAAMTEQLTAALEAIGLDAASTAAGQVPVDTGNLKNSISYAVDGNTVYIGTNVDYAVYHELGTGIYAEGGGGRQTPWVFEGTGKWAGKHITMGVRPRHFLQHGVTAHQDEYANIIKEHLQG